MAAAVVFNNTTSSAAVVGNTSGGAAEVRSRRSSSRIQVSNNNSRTTMALGLRFKPTSLHKLRSQWFGQTLWSLRGGAPLPDRLTLTSRPVVVARLFGPAIFEASKLKVLFLGDGKDKHPDELPRAYTLTHSDLTAKLTLAVSQSINKAQIQGWYSRLQRDEVLAEWKKSQGSMALHVHCHISGGHWLLDAIAKLRFYIFRKELPVVLEAFRYGDQSLLEKHPELEEALVWVYFHSNVKEFNRVECWGPLREAAKGASEAAKQAIHQAMDEIEAESSASTANDSTQRIRPVRCPHPCNCCFPPLSLIPLPPSFQDDHYYNVIDYLTTATNNSSPPPPPPPSTS